MRIFKTKANLYKVESSEPGKFYLVDLKKNTCTCPGYIYKKKDCKHIRAVKEVLNIKK